MGSGSKILQTLLRVLQFIFSLLVLALSSALVSQQNRGGSPTRVNYSVYVAVFALLSLLYLIPASFMSSIFSPMATTILDALNTIFFLAAGIALAAQLHAHSCSDGSWLRHNGITNGGSSNHMGRRCSEANAMTAFEWFAFAAFLASLAISMHELRRGTALRSNSRRGPNMSGQKASMGQV